MNTQKKPRLPLGARVSVDGREGKVIGSSDIGEDPGHLIQWSDTDGTAIVPMSRCKQLRFEERKRDE